MDVELSQRLALVIDWIAENKGFQFREEFVARCDEAETLEDLSSDDQALVLQAEIELGITEEDK